MHELSITQSVVDTIAEKMAGATVTGVCLEIGQLSGVVPDSVRFCFELVCSGTNLDGAWLNIVEPPGHGLCQECRSEFGMTDMIPLCPCGSANVRVLTGQELKIKSVEVS